MSEGDAGADGTSDAETTGSGESGRPTFRGCVACYAAEWVAYAVRAVR